MSEYVFEANEWFGIWKKYIQTHIYKVPSQPPCSINVNLGLIFAHSRLLHYNFLSLFVYMETSVPASQCLHFIFVMRWIAASPLSPSWYLNCFLRVPAALACLGNSSVDTRPSVKHVKHTKKHSEARDQITGREPLSSVLPVSRGRWHLYLFFVRVVIFFFHKGIWIQRYQRKRNLRQVRYVSGCQIFPRGNGVFLDYTVQGMLRFFSVQITCFIGFIYTRPIIDLELDHQDSNAKTLLIHLATSSRQWFQSVLGFAFQSSSFLVATKAASCP